MVVYLKGCSELLNKNTEYEQLVAQIHQGMLGYDGFENLRVEHDVTLVGKSGATHQIDVYWEFKAAGTTYKTCVECKNYSSAVKKTHVAAFAEILRDIGNANGIMATTLSFQKGAKQLAAENNIRLVLVNHLLKTIHLKMQPILTHFNNINLSFNKESIREALKRNDLESYNLNYHLEGHYSLLDFSGEKKYTFNTFINKQPKKEGKNIFDASDLFIDLEGIGLVELESIMIDVSYSEAPLIESIIESPNSATAIIEDIVENNIHYLHDDGTVNEVPNNA